MTTHEPGGEGGVHERFEYFMVRITRSAREPDRVAGLVERLGSGEKRSFNTGEQLVRLVGGGFALDLNMQPVENGRNATAPETGGFSNNNGR
ncbi:MAG: hypothetical protein ACJ8BF_09890 [Gemmatimonadales bacterium]